MKVVEATNTIGDLDGSQPVPHEAKLETLTFPELVLGRIRALAKRRFAWLETIGQLPIGTASVPAVSDIRVALDDLDSPEAERKWAETTAAVRATTRLIQRYTHALRNRDDSPLLRLARIFELSEADQDIVEFCLAVELDPSLAPIYGLLQRNSTRGYVTEPLVSRVTLRPREPLLLPSSPLIQWEIIEPAEIGPCEPKALRLDPQITALLCERTSLDPALHEATSVLRPVQPLAQWPIAALSARIQEAVATGGLLRVVLVGPHGSGRRSLAACLAHNLGLSAIGIDTSAISDVDWPRAYLRAQRQSCALNAPIVWHGGALTRRIPKLCTVFPLQFVAAEPDCLPQPNSQVADERIMMPRLSVDERVELWRSLVSVSRTWPPSELSVIAERFRLQVGDIAAIGQRPTTSLDEVHELCRLATRDRLAELAQLVECTYSRADLVLPEKAEQRLDELLFEARDRSRFWENPAARRLFPSKGGLVAMFAGSPGTGKTMAAQVIAAELCLDLFRIDLASLVSKYIGETAKNLRRIFIRAEEMNAVLLFDEADALFAKRTDVRDSHDRYANADTNYLLQMLEGYSGIAILASNKRENIDPAFMRRIRYNLEFSRPTEGERLRIWRRLLTELLSQPSLGELGGYVEAIAQVFEMSGAQIKFAVLTAIFAARRSGTALDLSHLLHGIGRELLKEGRSITPKERERIERHA